MIYNLFDRFGFTDKNTKHGSAFSSYAGGEVKKLEMSNYGKANFSN